MVVYVCRSPACGDRRCAYDDESPWYFVDPVLLPFKCPWGLGKPDWQKEGE